MEPDQGLVLRGTTLQAAAANTETNLKKENREAGIEDPSHILGNPVRASSSTWRSNCPVTHCISDFAKTFSIRDQCTGPCKSMA